jgi:hypothetical protein
MKYLKLIIHAKKQFNSKERQHEALTTIVAMLPSIWRESYILYKVSFRGSRIWLGREMVAEEAMLSEVHNTNFFCETM